MIVFAAALLARRPRAALSLTIALLLSAYGLYLAEPEKMDRIFESAVDRQRGLADPLDAESLNGRKEIWVTRLQFLNEDGTRWLVGGGFGSARDIRPQVTGAHLMPLHIVTETGLLGLAVAVAFFATVLGALRRQESGQRPLYYATLAILVSSAAQEPFYPVAAFGLFPGFYLVCVTVALNRADQRIKVASDAGQFTQQARREHRVSPPALIGGA